MSHYGWILALDQFPLESTCSPPTFQLLCGVCGKIMVIFLKHSIIFYKHLFLVQCSHQPLSYFPDTDSGKRVNPGKGERERERLILWYAKKFSWLQYSWSAAQRQHWSMKFTWQFQFNHVYFICVHSEHTCQIVERYYELRFDLNNALFRYWILRLVFWVADRKVATSGSL